MQDTTVRDQNGVALGEFLPDTAGFRIHTPHLPTGWEYIYQNKDVLLKVDQYGPVYAQHSPPGGIQIFRRENGQRTSPWLVWLRCAGIDGGTPFNNFFYPAPLHPARLPQDYEVVYRPESALYRFLWQGVRVETEFLIPRAGCEVVMRCTVSNQTAAALDLQLFPALAPYMNPALMAPWDKYEWYLKSAAGRGREALFWTQLLSSESDPAQRKTAALWTDAVGLERVELSLEKYMGCGSWDSPEALAGGALRLAPPQNAYGEYADDNTIYGYPPVYAQQYGWQLAPGESRTLTQVLAVPQQQGRPWLAPAEEAEKGLRFFAPGAFEAEKQGKRDAFAALCAYNRIDTGDEMFDYYANHWVPLQMDWVTALDRGWPTGMRGTRDSAQDYAGLLFSGDFASCREVLLTLFSCQRCDGWFPRQYAAEGRKGRHDMRNYVDGGAFVIEYVWQYLAHSGDFGVLDAPVLWLDSDEEESILAHLLRAMDYYLQPGNLGEHGLCKLREGDWLDSLNRAGVEGRGESVMVSEQVVMCARYVADILGHLGRDTEKIPVYLEAAGALEEALLTHARNGGGFFSGAFTDGGDWVFSDKDPDGLRRPYGPSNWYAAIAGIVKGEQAAALLEQVADDLLGPCGYRLYAPPMGGVVIPCTGRAGSGDTPPYQAENGNVYNHGSQGFLARGLGATGQGGRLAQVLRWLLPYDQSKHPTARAMAAPYAITNCWQESPLFPGRVLMTFLTGSVAMAQRGIYEWMLGIRPQLGGLALLPALAEDNKGRNEAVFHYRGRRVRLSIYSAGVGEAGLRLNGQAAGEVWTEPFGGRQGFYLPAEAVVEDSHIELYL